MKIQSLKTKLCILTLSCLCCSLPAQQNNNGQMIHLKMNDAQIHFGSKIYELKNVASQDIIPFVIAVVQRYNTHSSVKRITDDGGRQAILVSTGVNMFPYLDSVIAALDRPGLPGKDQGLVGTGVMRLAYTPRYRAALQFSSILDKIIASSVGRSYVNPETNTIFWLDQKGAAKRTLGWLSNLDRPLPQVMLSINYYELRDSDLKDWGFDYLAWKNGPGVNLLNLGYNAGHIAVDQAVSAAVGAATWGFGGFFTAPQFDMSFIRCLQQSGTASVTGNATLTMVNTPVASEDDYITLLQKQYQSPNKTTSLYKVSMYPEYQNIAKNTLGRSFVGKSFYTDEDGEKHADPPALDIKVLNPFICFQIGEKDANSDGFIPSSAAFYSKSNTDTLPSNGGVIFDYSLYFKNVVERGNTGSELSNSATVTGSATLGFGFEKLLAVYEKENDVEQTIGLPVLCRIPLLKYLFSTVTTIKERTYVIVTVEASLAHPENVQSPVRRSRSTEIHRRIENPLKIETKDNKK